MTGKKSGPQINTDMRRFLVFIFICVYLGLSVDPYPFQE